MCEVSFDHLALRAGLRELTAGAVHDRELAAMKRLGAELGLDRALELAPAPDQELLGSSERRRGATRATRATCSLESGTRLVDTCGGRGEAGRRVTRVAGGTGQLATPRALVARSRLPNGS